MNARELSKSERLQQISEIVRGEGEIGLDNLAVQLGVSRMTIHRDLEILEARGVLRKIRNGATAQPSSAFESNLEFRLTQAAEAKERMAAQAARLVEPGDVVLLDESTTLLPLLDHLRKIDGLTIITNFMPIQASAAKSGTFRLIGLGGEYVPQYGSVSGPMCEAMVSQLTINRYFTSISAIVGSGAFHPNSMIASAKRAMMRASVHRYLLADTSKFLRTALHRVAGLDEFDQIIIDAELPADRSKSLGHIKERLVIALSNTAQEEGIRSGDQA